jgi:hypothetical protein
MRRVECLTGVLRLSVEMELCGKVSRCSIEVGCRRWIVVLSGNDEDKSELMGILYIRDKFLVLLRLDCYSHCLEVAIHPRLTHSACRGRATSERT